MRILHTKASAVSAVSMVLWLAGCPGGDDTSDGGADAASGTTSATTSGTTEPGASTTSEPVTGTTSEPGPTSTSEPATGTTSEPGTATDATADSDTGPSPAACGDAVCSETEWCDDTDEECGATGFGTALCQPRPESCDDTYAPVCGCDGQLHSNDCVASMAGVDLDLAGECEAPDGYFRCGYRFCALDVEFCSVQVSDVGGYGDSYTCVQPAAECPGGITCDCLTEELCFEFGCFDTPDGGVEIGCPGG